MGVVLITLATITKQLYLFYGLVLAQIYLRSFFEIRKWQVLISGFFSAIFILFINYILWIYGLEINTNAPIERSSTVQLDVGRLPFDFERYLSITQTAFTTWFLEMFVMCFLDCFIAPIRPQGHNHSYLYRASEMFLRYFRGFCAF